MNCLKCGKELLSNSKICPSCGKDNNFPVEPQLKQYHAAPLIKRLANFLLDIFFILILIVIFTTIFILLGFESISNTNTFGILIFILYFVFFETLFQKTPGKLITKTKVVKQNGDKATFLIILERSLIRLFAFEFVSFFSNKYPVGWHDSWSKTIVVPSKYSKEDIEKISYNK